jgi:uncharacterized repeat protein (TIGR03803 family)
LRAAQVFVSGFCLVASLASLGSSFERVHSFGSPGPPTALVEGSDGSLYGMTQGDGDFAEGSLYRVLGDGTFETLHSFHVDEGAPPFTALVVGPDGDLYGIAKAGGAHGLGTIFKVNRAGRVSVLYSFDGTVGAAAQWPLVLGGDGALYGVSSHFGQNATRGTLFRVDRHGRVEKIHEFDEKDGTPWGPMIAARDGSLYGTTTFFTRYPSGNIFKIEPTGTFSTVYGGRYWGTLPQDLFPARDGGIYWFDAWYPGLTLHKTDAAGNTEGVDFFGWADAPSGPMLQTPDGTLYGVRTGGGGEFGSVIELDAQGNLTTLHTFDSSDGAYPATQLMEGEDGSLYGTTYSPNVYGSVETYGGLYKIDTRNGGAFTSLHLFDRWDGAYPGPSLTLRAGALYGTTASDGSFGHGSVFRLDQRELTTVHGFRNGNVAGVSGPLFVRDGRLLGAACGGIFEVLPDDRIQTIHTFADGEIVCPSSALVPGPDGALYGAATGGDIFRYSFGGSAELLCEIPDVFGSLSSPPTFAADGALYGITDSSGSWGGMVFRVGGEGGFQRIHLFDSDRESIPHGRLLLGADGDLYGAAGVEIFRIESDDAYRRLHILRAGEGVDAELVRARDGAIYGTTGRGCSSACYFFRIGPLGELNEVFRWSGVGAGSSPLAEGSDGAFYGTTSNGSATGGGTIYRVDAEGRYTVLHEFDPSDEWPSGRPLFAARDGAFYGATSGPRATVFRVDRRAQFRTLHVLDPLLDGVAPGPFFEDGDGDVYGLMSSGGPIDAGTLFRIRIDLPGDVNGDRIVDVQDVFFLVDYLFAGGPPPKGSADVNEDERVDVADVFYLIAYLFSGGPAPVG